MGRESRTMVAGLLTLAAGAMVAAGCEASEADRRSLQQGFLFYSQRQVEESEAAATKFIAANPAAPNIDEAYYLRGVSRLTRGGAENRKGAQEDLRLALEKTQRPDLRSKACRALGDILFEGQKWDEARELYQTALITLGNATTATGTGGTTAVGTGVAPTAPSLTYFNFRIGVCLQAVGKWNEAVPSFHRVISANTDPYLNERALVRVRANAFSLQFGAFPDRAAALALRSQLAGAGVSGEVITEFRENVLTYLVRSGSYRTYQEADGARERYIARYPLVTIIP